MLYTKSIFKNKLLEDGVRISVMSRHTLNDGITPDPRITKDSFDEHLTLVAPPAKLIGDYYKRGLTWEDYTGRYLEHLRKPEIAQTVEQISRRAMQQDITLLCVEDSAEYCHRRILAEECQKYNPSLIVIHK